MHAVQDALEEQRLALAATWINRYGSRPHRLDLPSPPSRPRRVAALDGAVGLRPGKEEQAMLALYDSGWLELCPRAAEIIGVLLDCPCATRGRLAELAAGQAPDRWLSAEQWLESSIWDGIRPPLLALPPVGHTPDLDECPPFHMLRHHMDENLGAWERWSAGFSALVEACDDPPVETMAELIAFWQDVGILVGCGGDGDHPLWTVNASLSSPWRMVYTRGPLVPVPALAAALDWLLEENAPLDEELLPREVFNLIVTSPGHNTNAGIIAS
ncbi:hypothetical protein ACIBO2_51880 [Nonomuraea sp. NPDC050022]|uniref:hypothetical protein n=1 Tax=unclassified Nonomuraea TaxID=2593643 RepID=UPI0033DF12CC